MPADILAWTNGRALVCTGIPVPPVTLDDTTYHIGQANNALVYPGLGLGTVVSRAIRVTPNMLFAAAEAVAGQVDPTGSGASLLPDVENLRASSATVALAVVGAAIEDGVAKTKPDNVIQAVQDAMWWPSYENGRR
jgi:malate dehydrogenase (oxaloacetate-decarboxylating)